MTLPSLAVLATLLGQAAPPTAAPAPAAPPPVETRPAPAAFTPKATTYGFLNFQVSQTDAPEPKVDTSTAEFRRARLGVKGDVTKEIGFQVLYDFADTSLKDAFATLKYVPGVEVRLGQFKTPFGYEQQESDTRLLWVNGSYAVAAMGRGRDSRDLGVHVAGRWNVAGPVRAELSVAGVNGAGPNAKDDLDEKNVWGRAGAVLSVAGTTTRLGGSYGYGRQVATLGKDAKLGLQDTDTADTFDDTYFYFHAAGADLSFDSRWAFVSAEWIQSRRRVTRHVDPATTETTDITPKGWYVGAYGKTPWNAGPVFRAEKARLPISSGAAQGTSLNEGWHERYTFGAYYDVVPVNARFILNYELDASPKAIRSGDRIIGFAQVMF